MELQHMPDTDLTAQFVFTLAQASTRTVTLSWETRDGTAVENIDYVPASGKLVFQPGETSKSVTIQVLQPPTEERKFFTVAITDAVNATVDETEPGQVVIMPSNVFRGKRGFRGDRGQQGMSAYQEAVANGSFAGSYQQWLDYLRAGAVEIVPINMAQRLHKKKILGKLPEIFPDYDFYVQRDGNTYLYPQGFYVDERSDQVLVVYNASGGAISRVVATFKYSTQQYQGSYQLLTNNSGGGESITVIYKDGKRYAVQKYDDNFIALYDITGQPLNRAAVAPSVTYPIGMYFQLAHYKGQYIFEEKGPAIGGGTSRTVFGVYNDQMQRTGIVSFSRFDSGFQALEDNPLSQYIPKRQGIAIGDGFIVTAHGGIVVFDDYTDRKFSYQGVRLYNMDGKKVYESICEPYALKKIFEENGMSVTRFEIEGVCVTESGKIITMNLYQGRFDSGARTEGIVMMEEFTSELGAIDFTPAVYSFPSMGRQEIESGLYPRAGDGKMYNPVSGEVFSTMAQLLQFMSTMEIRCTSYYHAAVGITALPGMLVDNFTEIKITNIASSTFHVATCSNNQTRHYWVTGVPGAPVANPVRNSSSDYRLEKGTGVADKLHRVFSEPYDPSLRDVLTLDQQVFTDNTDLRIGGGSSAYQGSTRLRFFTAPTVNGASRECFQIEAAGNFRPGADNSFSVGTASFRVSQYFGGTSAISTSDERQKTDIEAIADAVLDAWAKVEYLQYRFKDAVEEKGGSARLHTGVVAQRVLAAFNDAGLDPLELGVLCYDEWDELPEIRQDVTHYELIDEEMVPRTVEEVVQEARAAGSLYGIRYEEALCLEAALQRRNSLRKDQEIQALQIAMSEIRDRLDAIDKK